RWRGSEDTSNFGAWWRSLPKCIGNVLRELDSTSYDYDERGNLITKSGGAQLRKPTAGHEH
ncbi:hypothetical protein, partial [Caballeronia sp. GAWG2-1]